jgi:dolichol-phosphate mannosyltransferase
VKKNGLVIASYKEIDALPILLKELTLFLDDSDVVIIADDSPPEMRKMLELSCEMILGNSSTDYLFSYGESKGGRGLAIRRGMLLALSKYPEIEYLFEMDADSSHQPEDIKLIRGLKTDADLVVGSRYIAGSKIIGWPLTRKVFSKFLNLLIPKLFGLKLKDVTNGLRRYKTSTARLFLERSPQNSGFIYLTEQAVVLNSNGCSFKEVSTTFINRTAGKSTVTYKEVISSLRGIITLISYQNAIKK